MLGTVRSSSNGDWRGDCVNHTIYTKLDFLILHIHSEKCGVRERRWRGVRQVRAGPYRGRGGRQLCGRSENERNLARFVFTNIAFAFQNGHTPMMKLVDGRDNSFMMMNPVMMTLIGIKEEDESDRLECLRLLIAAGADLDCVDKVSALLQSGRGNRRTMIACSLFVSVVAVCARLA